MATPQRCRCWVAFQRPESSEGLCHAVSGRSTSIAVVDDHDLFRAGLIELLGSVPDFAVTGEGASGPDAIALARDCQPDVMLLDVEMPGPGATATIAAVEQASPRSRIVILTMHDTADLMAQLLDAGAAGFLVKSAGREELVAAVAAARRGVVFVCASRASLLQLTRFAPGRRRAKDDLLSVRESEVMRQLAGGGSNREVAAALAIAEGTVRRHLVNIYAKLGAKSRIDAVRKAAELGIVCAPLAG